MKRFLQIFLTALIAVALSLSLAACNNDPPEEEKNAKIESISFSQESVSLEVGDVFSVDVSVEPEDASKSDLKWSSSDNAIVTVSAGKITAVAPGTAIVTAEAKNNDRGYGYRACDRLSARARRACGRERKKPQLQKGRRLR